VQPHNARDDAGVLVDLLRMAAQWSARGRPMHLRYHTKRQASEGRKATYRQALLDNKAAHRLPETLPPGYTWVKPYRIGGRQLP
jgi:hypothetical protein